MSCIIWNCRGSRSASTVRFLKLLCNKFKPEVIFLSETKSNSSRCYQVAKMIKREECFSVDSNNRSGGLSIMWTENIEVQILHSSLYLIHLELKHRTSETSCYLSCACGHPYWNLKQKFWDELTEMASIKDPWLIIGDPNETSTTDEKFKKNGLSGPSRVFLDNFLVRSGIVDLGIG